jgi:hypothetical protein
MQALAYWKTVTADRSGFLADIARLLESYPELRRRVPPDILARLV